MLTGEQLEDLAALLIARPIDSVEQLDVAELLHAVELAAAAAEHDACEKHLRRAATDAATARLISAELLAALQELRYACTDKAEAMADAAIANAVGALLE